MKAEKRLLMLEHTWWRAGVKEGSLMEVILEQIKFEGGTLREKQQDVQRPGGEQQGIGEDSSPSR